MELPALSRVRMHSAKPGIVPGSKVPIRFTEAAIVSYNQFDFAVYWDEKTGNALCGNVDKRFNGTLIHGKTPTEALNNWYNEYSKSGEGL